MTDMPSAREHGLYDLRRKRAQVASGVVLAVSFVLLIVAFQWAMALPAAALFAFLVMPSWLGAQAQYPPLAAWRGIGAHLLGFGVPLIGVMLMYLVLSKGRPSVMGLLPFVAIGAVCYSAYRWRNQATALERVRGERDGMALLQRLWRHYLGYAVGLAAGVGANLAWRDTGLLETEDFLTEIAFVTTFLAGKTVVDVSLPQPPLAPKRASLAVLQLAAMSPVWFGLPWGALTVATLLVRFPDPWIVDGKEVVLATVAGATLVVFLATAAVTYVLELAGGDP